MIPFLKKNKDGKKPPKSTVPRTAQESIPFQRMFEDGTCRVRPGYYTRTIQYQDINYQLAQQEDKTAIFEEWCSFLNFFDSSIKFELSFVNTATDSADFEKSIRIPYQKDGLLSYRLVVSEKPSVAMAYAKVLGATNRKDGYMEGNGYLVSWCVGHLVELAPPNAYGGQYVKWSIADLPILPQKWQYLVSASTKKQFGVLQKLMHRPDVDSIVCATDAG